MNSSPMNSKERSTPPLNSLSLSAARGSSSNMASSFRGMPSLMVSKKRRSNSNDNDDESSASVASSEKRKRLDTELVMSPVDFIVAAFRASGSDGRITMASTSPLFHSPTEQEIENYRPDVLKAVREQDFQTLRGFLKEGRSLQCCNRFGESLMHMACRRGFGKMVKFLVEEANCSLWVRDDYGRTAMHDAAWSPKPNTELMDYLLQKVPELLLMSDVRGHTPFVYVRKEHWKEWIVFLQERQDKLRLRSKSEGPLLTIA